MSAGIRRLALGLALSAGLGLSGCSEADIAATVDGRTISESAAQRTAQQINEAFDLQQPFTTGDAVGWLIQAPAILEVAEKNGQPQTDAAALAQVPDLDDPSAETLLLIRANSAIGALNQGSPDALQEIVTALSAKRITVNPRYGAFDPASAGLTPAQPDWIASP